MTSPAAQAWLEFADGRMAWLDQGACTIGRATSNTVVLDLPGISRNHAVIQPGSGGSHLLADLRSTNGTYVNGLRLEQMATLRDGDKLAFGDAILTYRSNRPAEAGSDSGATSVQIYSGGVWLLLMDIIGYTAHVQAVGAEAASGDFKQWLQLVRPVLIRSGCTINAYLGDALFAYWREDRHPAAQTRAALEELVALQSASPRPFRIILHHAKVRISGGLQGESLTGSDVIYLFRIEKSTKSLGSRCVLSEAAAASLQLADTARPLGRHPVKDFPGDHAFFGLG